MKKFDFNKNWNTEEGLNMLKNRCITKEMDKVVACLTYPTFQLVLEAVLKDGAGADEFKEGENGHIWLEYFTCIKGNTPEDRKELAEDDGLMWESYDYVATENDDTTHVDFSSDNWMETLEAEMAGISERYAKANNLSLENPNF